MQMQCVHAPVHTPEQVREIIREAQEIMVELSVTDEDRPHLFREACALLGARASTFVQPQTMPLDLSTLGVR